MNYYEELSDNLIVKICKKCGPLKPDKCGTEILSQNKMAKYLKFYCKKCRVSEEKK